MEYYLTQLTLVVASICGEELDVEDVLIKWDAEPQPAKTVTLPPEGLALALARNLGAIIIDNRGVNHGKESTGGNACGIPDREC